MEYELIKPIVRIGNSAGVIVPRSWLDKEAVVKLTVPDIKTIIQKIIDMLIINKVLEEVLGIYLIGSYARNEKTAESDIDVLVLTKSINKNIRFNNYSIILVSKENLDKSLEKNPVYYYPMIKEAKTIINNDLIDKYKKYNLTSKGVMSYIKSTKEALKMSKEIISLDKKLGLSKTGDAVAYSLVLRMRGIYILECIIKGKLWKKEELIEIINNISIYNRYLAVKENKVSKKNYIKIEDAEKIIKNIENNLEKLEKWAKEKEKKEKEKKERELKD